MSSANQPIQPVDPKEGEVVLAPGEKFFVRRLPLARDGEVATQVELALEGFSPFPAGQLYYGFCPNSGQTQVLVYAAYRKSFSAEDTGSWLAAAAVLPDFAVWLGASGVPAAGISLRQHDGRVEAVGWDGNDELPALIVVRPAGTVSREELITEVRRKAKLTPEAPVRELTGAVHANCEKGEVLARLANSSIEARFGEGRLKQADIRDKLVLAERRLTLRRDTLLWRGFAATLAGLAACLLLEASFLGLHAWMRGQQQVIEAQKKTVEQINVAQSMAKRLEEISAQRVLPFEMLAELQEKRPKSIEYLRASTSGLWRMEIEAQTASATDLRDFETEVRRLSSIDRVEVRDPRTRDGITTFVMEVTFKPSWFKMGGVGT